MGMTVNDLFSCIADMPITVSAIKNTPAYEYELNDREKKLIDLFRKVPLEKQEETLARIEFALLTLQ
jgi:hypothetical protein